MNTQAHAIINVALLSQKDKPYLHRYALLGGVLPDVPMFIFFGIETLILKHSQGQIWSERYFLPQWQNIFDIFNSIPFILIALGSLRSMFFKLCSRAPRMSMYSSGMVAPLA